MRMMRQVSLCACNAKIHDSEFHNRLKGFGCQKAHPAAPSGRWHKRILCKRLLHDGEETLKSWKPLLNTIFVQRLIGMFCAIECAQYLLCCLPGRGNGQNLWHPDQISFYSLESLYPIPRAVKSHLGREGFSSIFSRSLRI